MGKRRERKNNKQEKKKPRQAQGSEFSTSSSWQHARFGSCQISEWSGLLRLRRGKEEKICKSIPRREYSNEFSNQKLSAAAAALVIRQHVSYFIQNNQSGGVTPRLDEL